MEVYLVGSEGLTLQQNGFDGRIYFIASGISLVREFSNITGLMR